MIALLTNVKALDLPDDGCATKHEYTIGAVDEKKTLITALPQNNPIADIMAGEM